MEKYHVELTEVEAALVREIDLRVRHRSHDEGHAAYQANERPILRLLESLSERGAIARERLSYWDDPKYNTGGLKTSHRGVFERNGWRGREIYTHPHFIPYLRYFLFGADLPDAVVADFEETVGNPAWVTSSDIVPIGKCARGLARRYGLDRKHAAAEFFKLCLDMGLERDTAFSVRRAVMQLR